MEKLDELTQEEFESIFIGDADTPQVVHAATPYKVEYEQCDCGGDYPCGHPDYPIQIIAPNVLVEGFIPDTKQALVVANLTEVGYHETQHANAAFIVKACNSHQGLVDALQDLLNENSGREKSCGHNFQCICAGEKAKQILRLAITEAGKE